MCGRFALVTPQETVMEWFDASLDVGLDVGPDVGLDPPQPPSARYNICPTQSVTVITQGRALQHFRWGFIPSWYKTPSDGPLLINARSETIAEKPAFREACRTRRCLIPATGFYEWNKAADGGRDPFYIAPKTGGIVAFAGIWQTWGVEGAQRVNTCAIVTCAANETMSAVHHRMPVVIEPDAFGLWLGEEGKGAAVLMTAAQEDMFAFHAVSRAVNSAKFDDESLIEPLDA